MKIGILSDTHVKEDIDDFVDIVDKYFSDVVLLIHAGDYTSLKVVRYLQNTNKFCGVYGNNDGMDIKSLLKEKYILQLMGYRVGIIHGDHGPGKDSSARAYNSFIEDNADIIIFGHSHQPIIHTQNKVLMINPGSLTNKRRERWHSFVILDIQTNGISTEIKFI